MGYKSLQQATEQLPTCSKGIRQSICTLSAVVPGFPSLRYTQCTSEGPSATFKGGKEKGIFYAHTSFSAMGATACSCL